MQVSLSRFLHRSVYERRFGIKAFFFPLSKFSLLQPVMCVDSLGSDSSLLQKGGRCWRTHWSFDEENIYLFAYLFIFPRTNQVNSCRATKLAGVDVTPRKTDYKEPRMKSNGWNPSPSVFQTKQVQPGSDGQSFAHPACRSLCNLL